jgi:hypothetical protein
MVYRLFTEDKNRKEIEAIVGRYFDGFTVIPATGYWKGERERSLIIEISSETDEESSVRLLAGEIKQYNHQQAVLIERLQTADSFV